MLVNININANNVTNLIHSFQHRCIRYLNFYDSVILKTIINYNQGGLILIFKVAVQTSTIKLLSTILVNNLIVWKSCPLIHVS